MSETRMPITLVRWLRRLRATRLASYPSSSMTTCTRATVAAATPYRSLMTLETVATDTPARAATSRIVTRLLVSTGRIVTVEIVIDND